MQLSTHRGQNFDSQSGPAAGRGGHAFWQFNCHFGRNLRVKTPEPLHFGNEIAKCAQRNERTLGIETRRSKPGTQLAQGEAPHMAKIVSLAAYKELQTPAPQTSHSHASSAFARAHWSNEEELTYRARILSLTKVELLEEMVTFQQKRTGLESLTPQMMLQGKILFAALERSAETQELQLLARSYRRHLEQELQAVIG